MAGRESKGEYLVTDLLDTNGRTRAQIGSDLTEFLQETFDDIVAAAGHAEAIKGIPDAVGINPVLGEGDHD